MHDNFIFVSNQNPVFLIDIYSYHTFVPLLLQMHKLGLC